jgi:hypothetical protein
MKVSGQFLTSAALPLHEEPLARPTHWVCGWMGPSADLYVVIHAGRGWALASSVSIIPIVKAVTQTLLNKLNHSICQQGKNAFSINTTVTAGQLFLSIGIRAFYGKGPNS